MTFDLRSNANLTLTLWIFTFLLQIAYLPYRFTLWIISHRRSIFPPLIWFVQSLSNELNVLSAILRWLIRESINWSLPNFNSVEIIQRRIDPLSDQWHRFYSFVSCTEVHQTLSAPFNHSKSIIPWYTYIYISIIHKY